MTIVIPTYERRSPLLRLLRTLDAQVCGSPELGHHLRVVVVVDGSTDGSAEAVEAETWRVPVEVVSQPNRGLAAARNVGLGAAAGGLVWFLDDDLIPGDGLLERHRRAHQPGAPHIVVGPCRLPADTDAPEPLVRWWDAFYAEMAADGRITRFDQFTAANASAPAALLAEVGGFDERFVGYGMEDYELGVRLLGAGTVVRFDAHAVAWHPDVPARGVLIRRQRSIGYNAARIAHLHPATADTLFPPVTVSTPRRIIRQVRIRRPRSLAALSHVAYGVCRLAAPVHSATSVRAEHLARAAAHAAGVAEGDPGGRLLTRVLDAT